MRLLKYYVECRYAECRYAECRGALKRHTRYLFICKEYQ